MDFSVPYCLMALRAKKEMKLIFPRLANDTCFFMKYESVTQYILTQKETWEDDLVWILSEEQWQKILDIDINKFTNTEEYIRFLKSPYHSMDYRIPFTIFSSFEQYLMSYWMKRDFNKIYFRDMWIDSEKS